MKLTDKKYLCLELDLTYEEHTIEIVKVFNSQADKNKYMTERVSEAEMEDEYLGYDEKVTTLTDEQVRTIISVNEYLKLNPSLIDIVNSHQLTKNNKRKCDMKAEHLNAILTGTKTILTTHLGIKVKNGKPYSQKEVAPSNEISVILGVKGQVGGQLIFSFDKKTALEIIGRMMGGMSLTAIDDLGWSALQEVGNWFGGHTATNLANVGAKVDITPPMINEGTSNYRSSKAFITIPLESEIIRMNVHVSLSEEK